MIHIAKKCIYFTENNIITPFFTITVLLNTSNSLDNFCHIPTHAVMYHEVYHYITICVGKFLNQMFYI